MPMSARGSTHQRLPYTYLTHERLRDAPSACKVCTCHEQRAQRILTIDLPRRVWAGRDSFNGRVKPRFLAWAPRLTPRCLAAKPTCLIRTTCLFQRITSMGATRRTPWPVASCVCTGVISGVLLRGCIFADAVIPAPSFIAICLGIIIIIISVIRIFAVNGLIMYRPCTLLRRVSDRPPVHDSNHTVAGHAGYV